MLLFLYIIDSEECDENTVLKSVCIGWPLQPDFSEPSLYSSDLRVLFKGYRKYIH